MLIKSERIENLVVDEANERTYVVIAERTLADGGLYSIIRLELLRRGYPLARGERLVISDSKRSIAIRRSEMPVELPPE